MRWREFRSFNQTKVNQGTRPNRPRSLRVTNFTMTDLNVVSTVFDDQTQLTTDRISRSILYDLTELENASRLKKGEDPTRTPKKIANVDKWFVKLDTDFAQFLSYFG